MKEYISSLAATLLLATAANAQVGEPFIHDPATLSFCEGKYYTFGTGGGGLVSEDGWTWHKGPNCNFQRGAAPDVLKIGDRFLVAYSATGGGLGGSHSGEVRTMWTKSFDPQSPNYGYTDFNVVATSVDGEDCDAIDAGLLLDPTTGRLWCSYGTYFGNIRIVELDPETGARLAGNEPVDIAIDCEATDLIYRDGWYYLLGTHGTCCDGPNSTYNIVVGRSRNVTGPYLDNMGRDMMKGGGKMVIAAHDRVTGPGHFGRTIIEDGVEVMSCHFEADFDRGGYSTLGIRPLLWQNGWPVAGKVLKEGTYEIESVRRGYAVELSVDFVRINSGRRMFWGIDPEQSKKAIPDQKLEDVIGGWPKGDIIVRACDYMFRPNQKWVIKAAEGKGGYLGAPYYTIMIEGTERALAVGENDSIIAVEKYSGADEQLWRIEQLIDGTYRIMPKAQGDSQKVLMSAGDSHLTLGTFNANDDNVKWNLNLL
ncbi:MAG: family 43 glycosylhydrolase [Bacteroidales bacterium]|nr:family 43 glycosylhydrolase [Bacteroidales bacterium]